MRHAACRHTPSRPGGGAAAFRALRCIWPQHRNDLNDPNDPVASTASTASTLSSSPARPPTPLPTTPTTAVPPVPPTAAPTVSPTDARPRSRPARLLQPWLVLLAALGLTLTAAVLAQRAADAREQATVLRAVEEDMRRLQARMDAYVALLRATRAFVDTQDERLSRETFAEFVARLRIQRDYPGIQGVGWTPRVDGQRVAGFEAGARAQGLDGFTVHPPGPREPMFSILYLEPLDARNRAALGYDMSTEPVRGRAMAEARDHAGPALTGRVTLKQEIDADKQAGFLMYVPVYAGGAAPATVAQRRSSAMCMRRFAPRISSAGCSAARRRRPRCGCTPAVRPTRARRRCSTSRRRCRMAAASCAAAWPWARAAASRWSSRRGRTCCPSASG